MLTTISTLTNTIWIWVPAAIVGLKFATEFLRFYLTATVVLRRLRHRRRHRRRHRSRRHPDRLGRIL